MSLHRKHVGFVLAVGVLVANLSCSPQDPAPADDDRYDEQLDRDDRQADKWDEQTERVDRLLARQEAQLVKSEEQLRRYDAVLDKWEEQAQRHDVILDRWEQQGGPAKAQVAKTLPLTPAERDAFFHELRDHFNAHDSAAIYEVMSAYAQARIDREQFDAQLEKMFEWFGRIQSADHSETAFVRNQDGLDLFEVRYTARFSGGILAEQGTTHLTVSYDGEKAELVGVNMTANATQP